MFNIYYFMYSAFAGVAFNITCLPSCLPFFLYFHCMYIISLVHCLATDTKILSSHKQYCIIAPYFMHGIDYSLFQLNYIVLQHKISKKTLIGFSPAHYM